jgi:hypothetical protein
MGGLVLQPRRMQSQSEAVALAIDYPERALNRLSTASQPFVALPILVLLGAVLALATDAYPPFGLGP